MCLFLQLESSPGGKPQVAIRKVRSRKDRSEPELECPTVVLKSRQTNCRFCFSDEDDVLEDMIKHVMASVVADSSRVDNDESIIG